ncbi:MAG TPA: response regulator transcription factor [Terracidiphilus sp.]|nr:response regulator transcription factor [Terracidiphilus sp.]
MSSISRPDPIRIGVASEEPIRLTGLTSIFDQPAQVGRPSLVPQAGRLEDLLEQESLGYLVVDLQSSSSGLEVLETIRRSRPDLRLIVIGPQGNDELVLDSIIAGARAYLSFTADPETVFKAIEVVTEGSIWAPRKLLSRLIDRLLKQPETRGMGVDARLTDRERQVLELITMARSNREIAEELGIEERTVKTYVGRLMRKTGADNRIKLSMSALSLSIMEKQGKKT